MDKYSDIELVSRAEGGDARALQRLFERHYLTVYRLAYRWCGGREDAEDIAQEVFVKLVRKLHTFRQKSSFRTWLYRIVVNTSRDFGRKRAARKSMAAAFAEEQRLHNPVGNPGEALTVSRLQAAMEKLPRAQKEAVMLVTGEGLSHRDAARVLGCRETTVSWRIFQARKKLKKSLEQEI
jgi:RNA polymerase sigma-70 factor (ECF subfamily)